MLHFRFSLIVAFLAVCQTHAWLDGIGWNHECRFTNMGGARLSPEDVSEVNVTPTCTEGIFDWNYPQFDITYKLNFKPDFVKGPFQVCLLKSSSADAISRVKDVTASRDIYLDAAKLQNGSEDICAKSVSGKVSLLLYSGDWTYLQSVDFKINLLSISGTD